MQWEIGLSINHLKPEGNRVVAALPQKERQLLLQRSETVDMAFGAILCDVKTPMKYAYFPLSGLISLVATSSDQQPLGIAMIGNEGALGANLAPDIGTTRLRAVVHGAGTGLRIIASELRSLLPDCPALQSALRQYVYALTGQLLRTATCNSFHEVEMRLARWLLMTDDRTSAEQLPLTHQLLADMLGVKRSAVTIAAGKLQRKKLIDYSRGQISIVSRSGLENASCECYGMQIREDALQFAV